MSPTTWEAIKTQHIAEAGGGPEALTGRDVLGIFTTRFSGPVGVAIWHDGGVDKVDLQRIAADDVGAWPNTSHKIPVLYAGPGSEPDAPRPAPH